MSSDSTPSSPKQSSSELLASETSDVVDEFLPTEGWFGADINDEISNDLYSEVHIDIKPDKETMNSSKNNRKRPVCSQDDLSASDYKIDSTVNKKSRKISGETIRSHSKDSKIKCMLCKEFFDQSEYRRHSRIEHAFKCDQESCDYHLENQLSLINHKKKVHFIEPSNSYSSNWKLECEACGKSFAKTKIE